MNTYIRRLNDIVAGVLTWNSLVTLKNTWLFSASGNSSPYMRRPQRYPYLVEQEYDLVEQVHALQHRQVLLVEQVRFLHQRALVQIRIGIVVFYMRWS